MKTFVSVTSILATSCVVTFMAGSAIAAETVVYDNTTTQILNDEGNSLYLGTRDYPAGAYGDSIRLNDGQGSLLHGITQFTFSVATNPGFVAGAAKTWTLNLYALNGPGGTPGTALTDPVNGAILSGQYEYAVDFDAPVVAPRDMAWAVSFNGVSAPDDVGLELYGPPSVGTSGNNFWLYNNAGDGIWTLNLVNNGNTVGSFYAKVLAIPEPSTVQLGLLALAGFWAMRRRS